MMFEIATNQDQKRIRDVTAEGEFSTLCAFHSEFEWMNRIPRREKSVIAAFLREANQLRPTIMCNQYCDDIPPLVFVLCVNYYHDRENFQLSTYPSSRTPEYMKLDGLKTVVTWDIPEELEQFGAIECSTVTDPSFKGIYRWYFNFVSSTNYIAFHICTVIPHPFNKEIQMNACIMDSPCVHTSEIKKETEIQIVAEFDNVHGTFSLYADGKEHDEDGTIQCFLDYVNKDDRTKLEQEHRDLYGWPYMMLMQDDEHFTIDTKHEYRLGAAFNGKGSLQLMCFEKQEAC